MTPQSRRSTFDLTSLPTPFGTVVLTLVLVLVLTPYLSGANVGIFRVPTLGPSAKNVLRFAGPVAMVLTVGLFIPIWAASATIGQRELKKLIRQLNRGSKGARREAAIELRKLGPAAEAAVPDLIKALDDSDLHLREDVAQALEAVGSLAVRHLITELRHGKGLAFAGDRPMVARPLPQLSDAFADDGVRGALVEIGRDAVPALTDALEHVSPDQRAFVAAALKSIYNSELDQIIAEAASGGDESTRLNGAVALAETASVASISALSRLLLERDRRMRVVAIAGLGKTRSEKAIPLLIEVMVKEKDSLVRYEAVRALKILAEDSSEALPPLIRALRDPAPLVQLAAVMAAGEIGPSAKLAIPELLQVLCATDTSLRMHAATALGSIGGPDARVALASALSDKVPQVRQAAAASLQRIDPSS